MVYTYAKAAILSIYLLGMLTKFIYMLTEEYLNNQCLCRWQMWLHWIRFLSSSDILGRDQQDFLGNLTK